MSAGNLQRMLVDLPAPTDEDDQDVYVVESAMREDSGNREGKKYHYKEGCYKVNALQLLALDRQVLVSGEVIDRQ
jgi:hypothetical protein